MLSGLMHQQQIAPKCHMHQQHTLPPCPAPSTLRPFSQVHFQWSSTIPNVDLSEATSSSLAFTPQDLLGNVEIGKVREGEAVKSCCCCCLYPTLKLHFKL